MNAPRIRTVPFASVLLAALLLACGDDDKFGPVFRPPIVEWVVFPDTIPGHPGAETTGRVRYRDKDGDIVYAYFDVVSTDLTFEPFDFDPGVYGQTEGYFDFVIYCNPGGAPCSGASVTLEVTLEDETDKLSDPVDFSFTYQ